MPDDQNTKERTIARIRDLPAEQVDMVSDFLDSLAEAEAEGTYQLSDEELSVLKPALQRAKMGDFADDEQVEKLLKQPWK